MCEFMNVYIQLSVEGQKALFDYQKDLHLCSENEQKSYEFGMT